MTRPRPIHARWGSTPRRTFAGAALVLMAGLFGSGLVSAGPAEPERGITIGDALQQFESPPPPPQAQPGTATVTLITGDQVRLDTAADGSQEASPVNAETDAFRAPATQFSWGGDQYVVPGEAVPYLGRVLDPTLFNVSYLARAGLDDAGSQAMPVTIKQAGGRAAELPAVQVAGEAADGTVTAAVAKSEADAFGARLGQAWYDSRSGTSATPVGQLPGIERITLAAPQGAEPAPELPLGKAVTTTSTSGPGTRNVRYRTITFDPIERSGEPGFAIGLLHNLDNPRAFSMVFNTASAGPVSFSVPEGTYSAEISVLNGPANNLFATGALVVEPELRITADRTITLDARRAVPFRPNVDPAVAPGHRFDHLVVRRINQAREGGATNDALLSISMKLMTFSELGSPTLFVTPTAPVTRGHLELLGLTRFSISDQTSSDPGYVFAYRWDGAVPTTLTPPVPRAELTTVRSAVHRSQSGSAMNHMIANMGIQTPLSGALVVLGDDVPFGERVDYWYTNQPDNVVWHPFLTTDEIASLNSVGRKIRPGEEIRLVWNKSPLVPAAGWPDQATCGACRQDDNVAFVVWPFADSTPGHREESQVFDPTLRNFEFYRNGTLALTSRGSRATADTVGRVNMLLPMLPEPADYRLQWDTTRNHDPQAWVRTGWTFRSSRDDPAAALPGNVACAPDPGRACSFLPLLFVRYDLPLDLNNRAAAGAPFELNFHIGSQQFQPAPAGVSATVSVSFDSGTTWSEPVAAADRGDGRFTTTVTHPQLAETDGFVALRVQARDAAGNTVDQVITRAYGLAG